MEMLRKVCLMICLPGLLVACGGGGGGAAQDNVPPTVPQNLSASPIGTTQQVDLVWDASTDTGGSGVAGYKVYRDGALVASVTATSYRDTGLTEKTDYSYQVSAFDHGAPANESAKSSPSEVTTPLDTTPPTVPKGLSAGAISATQVDLTWDASTDVGGSGVAGYKVYRDGELVAPSVPATSYSDTGLTEKTDYSYQVSAFDNAAAANESARSTPAMNVKTLFAPISYDFTSGDVSDWSVFDDSGVSSTWQVISGAYHQVTDVDNWPSFATAYNRGTYSFLPSLTGFSDYRFSVDITPLDDAPPVGTDDGKDVGIMFRYQDNDNYYRLSFSARKSFTRLEKKVGGAFTTLATDSRGYVDGQDFKVAVNLSGDQIQVMRDGDALFAVSDTSLSAGTVALYSQDAVKFDNVLVGVRDPNPTIVISTPLAHSVSGVAGVTALAGVTNLPAGGRVDFAIGGTPCGAPTQPSPGLYHADCGSPLQGDYDLAATLRNDRGGVVVSDSNQQVGVLGDYYVTIGDSITEGSGDFFIADNRSQDGRIIGQQSYQASLDDLLTASTSSPNIVFNEGVGGFTTTDALTRINSLLERHQGANKALMMLGTNDSGGGTPLSPSAYRTNMQSLVNTITGQGKTVWVARVPPVLPFATHTTRNGDIQGYNAVVNGLTNIQLGPDFFSFFYDDNGTPGTTGDDNERGSLFALNDNLHPNSLGYRVMAQLWHNALTGGGAAPFFLGRLCDRLISSDCSAVAPTNHKQSLLQVGRNNEYYIDETYTPSSIPAVLADGIWIMTANAERNNPAATYIRFTVDRPVTVYVAYDAGAGSRPNWLANNFTDAGLNLKVTDPSSPTLHAYKKDYPVGTISLGGNLAPGASGADSNYVAIVVEQ
jgi:lysophospholipase L1-like esterase/chitodextrinase